MNTLNSLSNKSGAKHLLLNSSIVRDVDMPARWLVPDKIVALSGQLIYRC